MKKTFIRLTMLCLMGVFMGACGSRTSQNREIEHGEVSAFFKAENDVEELTVWSYETQGDYLASIVSVNYYPQDGYNLYLMLSLLYTPDATLAERRIVGGVALYSLTEKPQYSAGTSYMLVKFDNGEFEKWEGSVIRNGHFFVFNNIEQFIAKLKSADRCVIAINNNLSFVFNSVGLRWNY